MPRSCLRYGLVCAGIWGLLAGGQSYKIPIDWGGQFGMVSQDGQLFWNRDWYSGVLLFDGTFAVFPERYGPRFDDSFRPKTPGDFPFQVIFPDSQHVRTGFEYRQGDYLYDQLDIHADFLDLTRQVKLNAFKRNYGNTYGQYLHPRDQGNPIQQSYQIDIASQHGEDYLDLGIAYLITSSGLPDTSFNGLFQDWITTVGVAYIHPLGPWTLKVHGSQFNEKSKIQHSSYSGSGNRWLNRSFVQGQLVRKRTNNSNILIGSEANWQSYRTKSSSLRRRFWETIYGGIEGSNHHFRTGITLTDFNAMFLYLDGEILGTLGPWEFISALSIEPRPAQITWNEKLEVWTRLTLGTRSSWDRFQLSYDIQFSHGKFDEQVESGGEGDEIFINPSRSPYFIRSQVQFDWQFIRRWNVSTVWEHLTPSNSISTGIGNRILVSVQGRESLFSGHLLPSVRLWIEGWLDRDPAFAFNLLEGYPFQTQDPDKLLDDAWVLNLETSATISQVILSLNVYNVPKIAEALVTRVIPDLKSEDLLIRNNYFFPSMGRLLSFNITWEFSD